LTEPPQYSIWIVPPLPERARLSDLIDHLSTEHSTPPFRPHVTVLGDLTSPEREMLSRTSALAMLLTPFTIRLGSVSYSDDYFRSLYVEIEESDELARAHREAARLFGIAAEEEYLPHLSLMYGQVPVTAKEDIIRSIEADLPDAFDVGRVHMVLSSSLIPPRDWRSLREFAFGS
jgi:2'-5' RNA ligase